MMILYSPEELRFYVPGHDSVAFPTPSRVVPHFVGAIMGLANRSSRRRWNRSHQIDWRYPQGTPCRYVR